MHFMTDDFRCGNHQCVPSSWHCEGFEDCEGGEDEPKDYCGMPSTYVNQPTLQGLVALRHVRVVMSNLKCLNSLSRRPIA